MANLLDEALREIYKETIGRDPLAFMKDAMYLNAFPYLLKDIYHNYTEEGRLCANNQFHTKKHLFV
jgi:hypothetical protein